MAMADGTKSKAISKTVFNWINSKIVSRVPSIVHDCQEAISEIQNQWDSICGANPGAVDPPNVLQQIWPHVQRLRRETTLPRVTASGLQRQIAKRKPTAAAGLDGWRTNEAQALPELFSQCVADFFNEVENKFRKLPQCLLRTQQIMLEKPESECRLG